MSSSLSSSLSLEHEECPLFSKMLESSWSFWLAEMTLPSAPLFLDSAAGRLPKKFIKLCSSFSSREYLMF
uniref:Uncharacterized protein n=1 Tax=Arundo donax TaxID=35708 RepID=A0A0A9DAH0_ARUDO